VAGTHLYPEWKATSVTNKRLLDIGSQRLD